MNSSIFSSIVALNKVLPTQIGKDIYQCPNQSLIEQSGWVIYGNSALGKRTVDTLRRYTDFYTTNRLMDVDLRIPLINENGLRYLIKIVNQMFDVCPSKHGLIICHPRVFRQINNFPNLKCVTFGFVQDTLHTLVKHQDLWTAEEAINFRHDNYFQNIFYRRFINPVKYIYIYGDDIDSILYAAYAWHLQVKNHQQAPQIVIIYNSHFLYRRLEIAENILDALCPQADLLVWHKSSLSELLLSRGMFDALFIAPQHRAYYVNERLYGIGIPIYVIKENMTEKLYSPSTDVKSMLYYLNKSVEYLSSKPEFKRQCSNWSKSYPTIGNYNKADIKDIFIAAQQDALMYINAEKLKINQMFD